MPAGANSSTARLPGERLDGERRLALPTHQQGRPTRDEANGNGPWGDVRLGVLWEDRDQIPEDGVDAHLDDV